MEKVYGIVGYPLGHSFSQRYFNEKLEKEGLSDKEEFRNFQMEHITSLKDEVLNVPYLEGFCITIPHKKNIIAYLDQLSPEVEVIGACNCVRVKDGHLKGYNTDIVGFEKSFRKYLQPHHHKALILGTGGASAAVAYVLKKMNIPFKYVSRGKNADLQYADVDAEILAAYQIIINCTPLGTFPNVDAAPDISYTLLTKDHYLYDLVYNPAVTKFLQLGKDKGATIENGYEMLVLQAEENWKIWHN